MQYTRNDIRSTCVKHSRGGREYDTDVPHMMDAVLHLSVYVGASVGGSRRQEGRSTQEFFRDIGKKYKNTSLLIHYTFLAFFFLLFWGEGEDKKYIDCEKEGSIFNRRR